MDGLLDFFSHEAGQRRRRWLDEQSREVGGLLDYYLGPTGIPDKLGAAAGLLELTDAGDMPAAADASRSMWNNPSVGNAAELTAAGAALALPLYSARMGEGLADLADEAVRAYDPNVVSSNLVRKPTQPQGILAYHGSPHDFDRFQMDKIGTGEGAQVYGHGMYFAENEDVARSYRDSLAQRIDVDDKPILVNNRQVGTTGDEQLDDLIIANNGDIDAAIADERAFADEMTAAGKTSRRYGGDPYIGVRKLESIRDKVQTSNSGSMYEVRINANPDDFLDWDAPLSEQPEIAKRMGMDQNALLREADQRAQKIRAQMDADGRTEMTPAERAEYDQIQDLENLYARRSGAGAFADIESAYSRTGTTGNAADMARKELLYDYGIPGIKYRDAGSRGTEGGTRNFVVRKAC